MKQIVIIAFIFIASLYTTIDAQDTKSVVMAEADKGEIPTKNVLQIAPLIGTDVGGGIPFGNLPKQFQPFPKLNVTVGLWMNYIIDPRWQIGLNVSYKTIAMSANAKMENEYFYADPTGGGGEKIETYFTGIANQSMSFTMLEIPLIAKYGFGRKGQYRVLFGGYGAWIMNKSFDVTAKTGFQGPTPDEVDTPIDPSEPLKLGFSHTLRNWEAGLVIGYEQSITRRLNVDFVIYGGLNSIFIPNQQFLKYGLFPMRLGIHASYSLFEFAPTSDDKKFKFVYK